MPASTANAGHVPAEGSSLAAPCVVSVVIPCLNEAENIERCVALALQTLQEHSIVGEVIVADNASEDQSAILAANAGARVIHEPRRGYGSAYLAGFAAARGTYIVMADADLTYDFAEIPRFLKELEAGAEMVVGIACRKSIPARCHGTTNTSGTHCSPVS
jgi:glycosyltransferase involved in cell wall biosynthesis